MNPKRLFDVAPWWWFGGVVATLALLGILSWLSPWFYDVLVEPYLWGPIVHDEGFNPVNTAAFVLFVAAGILWLIGLFRVYGLQLDGRVEIAGLAFFAWGASLRVFHDADLYAPFAPQLAAEGLPLDAACAPGLTGAFVTDCFGAFFVTPLLWIVFAPLLFALARLALASQHADARGQGLVHHAATHVLLLGSYLAATVLLQDAMRVIAPLWTAAIGSLLGIGLVAWRRRVEGALHWSWGLLSLTLPLLATSAWWITTWMTHDGPWHHSQEPMPWLLLLLVAGPALLVWSMRWKAARLARQKGTRPGRAVVSIGYLLFLEMLAVFASMLALHRAFLGEGLAWWILAGPIAIGIGHFLTARGSAKGHPDVGFLMMPAALFMLGGQLLDGFTTSFGLDVFAAGEKHILPRTLIALIDALRLPTPLGDYPTLLAMAAYKVGITLAAFWYLQTRTKDLLEGYPNALLMLQLAVANIGFGPGIRNALRQAMQV